MTRRRQVGSGSGVEEEAEAGHLAWMRRRWGTEAAGQRRGGGAASSGRRRGGGAAASGRRRGGGAAASGKGIEGEGEGERGDRGRGREVGRRGGLWMDGGTILMAHHPSVRHKYIHTNGAPHPSAPLVIFFLLEPTGYIPPDVIHINSLY